jgi:hypothetical protein
MTQRRRQQNTRRISPDDPEGYREIIKPGKRSSPDGLTVTDNVLCTIEVDQDSSPDQSRFSSFERSDYTFGYNSASMNTESTDASPEVDRRNIASMNTEYTDASPEIDRRNIASMNTDSTDASPELDRRNIGSQMPRYKSADLGYGSSGDVGSQDLDTYETGKKSLPTDYGIIINTSKRNDGRVQEDISVKQFLETPVCYIYSMEKLIANHKLKPAVLEVSPVTMNATIQYQNISTF